MRPLEYILNGIRLYQNNRSGFLFFVTSRCNARCNHCFYTERINRTKDELSLDEIRRIAGFLKQKGIIITGGEPFLREDLFHVVKILTEEGISEISINSNGIATEKIVAASQAIASLPRVALYINISLDGMRETHDTIRNYKGAFDCAISTIRQLQGLGIKVSILTTVNAFNYREIPEVYGFCSNQFKSKPDIELIRGIDVSGIPRLIANRYYHPYDKKLLIKKGAVPDIRRVLKNFFSSQIKRAPSTLLASSASLARLESYLDIIEKERGVFTCYAGRKHGVIYENGDVALCEMAQPIGNLRNVEYNIWRLWNNADADAQRRGIRNCYCTHSCFINVVYSPYFFFRSALVFLRYVIELSKPRVRIGQESPPEGK